MQVDYNSMQNNIQSVKKRIDEQLLRSSIYGNATPVNPQLIDEIESDLQTLDRQAFTMDEKVEIKKMQLRVQTYKRNSKIMQVALESEEIGSATLSQLQMQREQLHRIDSEADTVGENVRKSHQVLLEMRRRKRKMMMYGVGIGVVLILIIGAVLTAMFMTAA